MASRSYFDFTWFWAGLSYSLQLIEMFLKLRGFLPRTLKVTAQPTVPQSTN